MAMSGHTSKLVYTGYGNGDTSFPIKVYVAYKSSQSVANNKSTVYCGMYVVTPSGYDIGPWTDWNGSYVGTKSNTFDGYIPNFDGTRWLAENLKFTVSHDDDGDAKATIYWKWGVNSTWGKIQNISGSFSVTLPTIPRASTIDSLSCATSYFTGKMTYKYTPKSSAYYNRCNIALNLDGTYIAVKSINLGKKSASQKTGTVTLSASELETIYNELPSATKGKLRFTLRTYSDSGYSKQIGDAGYKEVTLSIPNDSTTKASVSMSLAPVSSLSSQFDGLYIQGKTKVKATLSATGKYEATIKSYSMKVDGTTYDSDDSYTSGYLSKYGSITVYGYAKDSRGYTGSTSKKITVIAYSNPKILPATGESDVVAARCDADGNLSDSGTYLKIKAKRSYSTVKNDGVQTNFCQIRYRYKLESATTYSAWTTILAKDSLTSDEIVTGALLGGTLDIKSTYLVQVQVIDDIGGSAYTTISVPTDKVYWHRNGAKNSLGLGKYVEGENLLDCAWDAHFRGEVLIGDTGQTLKEYILAVISEGG